MLRLERNDCAPRFVELTGLNAISEKSERKMHIKVPVCAL